MNIHRSKVSEIAFVFVTAFAVGVVAAGVTLFVYRTWVR